MEVRIIVETTFENGTTRTHELGGLTRSPREAHSESLGFLLEDTRTMLGELQRAFLLDQIEEISAASRICPDCDRARALHDYRPRVLDTLFGRFRIRVPRIRPCACSATSEAALSRPISPFTQVLPSRATPELCRLQAELGARHSFREAVRIIETFLPCAKQMNTTVRNRLGGIAKDITGSDRSEGTTGNAASSSPLTAFIDGAHIRCRPEYQKRHLDVVVGKIETQDMSRRFGLAPQATASPSKQLRRDLTALGWDGRRPVTVISDGEAALPNLIRGATKGNVRHILDWWHISARVQHVQNAIKGLVKAENFPGTPVIFTKPAETLRWFLWHGKVQAAGTNLQWLMVDCSRLSKEDSAVQDSARRALARCQDLYSYLANNMGSLTN